MAKVSYISIQKRNEGGIRGGRRDGSAKNAQATAYDHLRDLILSGKLRAGATINPGEIAKDLGISRIPVREAVLQLEIKGLVTFGPNRRVTVTSLTIEDVLELFDIRIAIEALAIERATPKLTEELLQDLRLDLIRMDRAANDPKRWLTLHDEFHSKIYAAAQMPRLQEEIVRIRERVRPYILMYIDIHRVPEVPGKEHASLLETISSGDARKAKGALIEHIRDGAAGLVRYLIGGQTVQS